MLLVARRADAPPPLAAGLSKRAAPRMWTEEEHALFLHGLELGYRGRWAKLASEILHGGRTPAQARVAPCDQRPPRSCALCARPVVEIWRSASGRACELLCRGGPCSRGAALVPRL